MKSLLPLFLFASTTLFAQSDISEVVEFKKSPVTDASYKIRPDSLQPGTISKTGLKNGSFTDQQTGTVTTYRNGLRHGFYGEYAANGKALLEGFYSNGLQDSLAFTYYAGTTKLKTKGYYRKGKRDGIFLEFAEEGSLKSSHLYVNDVLVDKPNKGFHKTVELNFYDNGDLRSEAAYRNDSIISDEISYYEGRRIMNITEIANHHVTEYSKKEGRILKVSDNKDKVWRTLYVYPDWSKHQHGPMISPTPIPMDDTTGRFRVINTTDLVIEELFNNNRGDFTTTGNEMYGNMPVTEAGFYRCDSLVYAKIEGDVFVIKPQGLVYCYDCIDNKQSKRLLLKPKRKVVYNKETNYDCELREEFFYTTNIGEVIKHQMGGLCFDNLANDITIHYHNRTIEFCDVPHTTMYSYDADHDGIKEFYLLIYDDSWATFAIYRVKKR